MTRDAPYDFATLPTVASADELFRLAAAIEAEAARRYGELATRMAEAGHPAIAALFRDIQQQEREHEAAVVRWATSTGHRIADLPAFQWQAPEWITEDEIADAGGEALMTPAAALDLAVHNEERAFAYYVHIATEASNREVREYAERMAEEELDHVALLRLERRRANRARDERDRELVSLDDVETLMRYGWVQEAEADMRLRRAVVACDESGATKVANRLAALCGNADSGAAGGADGTNGAHPRELIDDALHHTETLYETYLRTAEQAHDETLVETAQSWASHVLKRLAHLNDCRATLLRRDCHDA